MVHNHPHNRRPARALAISQAVDRQRAAAVRLMLALTGLAGLAEAAVLAHRLWAAHA